MTKDFTIEEMKKLKELLEEKIKEAETEQLSPFKQLPYPLPYTPQLPIYPTPIPTHEYDRQEEWCAIREYFKSHPNETSVMMVCFCRLCSPQCCSSTPVDGQTGMPTQTLNPYYFSTTPNNTYELYDDNNISITYTTTIK